jgi:hypothetical protein
MTVSTFENVFCGEQEGQLLVTDEGLSFQLSHEQADGSTSFSGGDPSSSIHTSSSLPPPLIPWEEITHREFCQEEVSAGTKSYSTVFFLHELKIGVYPSRQYRFHTLQQNEWERLRRDFGARGQGLPTTEEDGGGEMGSRGPWEDYSAPLNDVKKDDEGQEGWSAQDTTPPFAEDTTYYPVHCKQEVGTLRLAATNLQFTPDRHSAAVKALAWNSLAGTPYFSPQNYPRATMSVSYLVTSGPNKKVSFAVEDHSVLAELEEDVKSRLQPWKNAPREKVVLPAKNHPAVERSFKKGRTSMLSTGKSKRSSFGAAVPSRTSYNGGHSTAFTTCSESSHNSGRSDTSITTASLTDTNNAKEPLVNPRKHLHHQEEGPRRLWMMGCATCCAISLLGLSLSILFGYLFGERSLPDPLQTAPPGGYHYDVLTKAPATSKIDVVLKKDAWSSEMAILSREEGVPPGEEGENPEDTAHLRTIEPTTTLEPTTLESATLVPTTLVPTTLVPTTSEHTIAPTTVAPTTIEPTTAEPTAEPTPMASPRTSIKDLIMDHSFDDGQALRTPGTPQQAAYLLLSVQGGLESEPDDIVLQKYALSVMYYSLGGNDWIEGSDSWTDTTKSDCLKVSAAVSMHLFCLFGGLGFHGVRRRPYFRCCSSFYQANYLESKQIFWFFFERIMLSVTQFPRRSCGLIYRTMASRGPCPPSLAC